MSQDTWQTLHTHRVGFRIFVSKVFRVCAMTAEVFSVKFSHDILRLGWGGGKGGGGSWSTLISPGLNNFSLLGCLLFFLSLSLFPL